MTPRKTITLKCNTTEINSILSEFDLYIAQIPLKFRKRFLRFFDAPAELIRFEHSPASVGTGLTVFLKPADLLLDLLSTCRTGNFEILIIERKSHITPPYKGTNYDS